MSKKPEIVLIAAVAEKNRVIGDDMDLPWRIPEDLKRFKRLTTGHALLMGRRTFESLMHQFGGPLPDRRNIVLTSRPAIAGSDKNEVEVYPSVEDALRVCQDETTIFIGGGAAIYEQFLPRADRMELTLVEGDYTGDTFFPPFEHLVGTRYEITDEDRRDGYRFVTYRRKQESV